MKMQMLQIQETEDIDIVDEPVEKERVVDDKEPTYCGLTFKQMWGFEIETVHNKNK